MSPTEGVIGEAWGHYKEHWRHLLPIALVVYVAIAILGALLTLALGWFGALLAAVISLVGLFWVQGALVTAIEDLRDGRADLSLGDTFDRVRPQLGAIVVAGLLAGLGIALGLVLLIVPGLVLMTWWVLVIPVVVPRAHAIEVWCVRLDATVESTRFQLLYLRDDPQRERALLSRRLQTDRLQPARPTHPATRAASTAIMVKRPPYTGTIGEQVGSI